jgi:hypothetical protein
LSSGKFIRWKVLPDQDAGLLDPVRLLVINILDFKVGRFWRYHLFLIALLLGGGLVLDPES